MPRARLFDAREVASFVQQTVEWAPPGPSCVEWPIRWTRATAMVAAEAVRRAGAVPLVPNTAACRIDAAAHRHIALFVSERRQVAAAGSLVKVLARASPRALVVFVTRRVLGPPTGGRLAEAQADDRRLRQLIRAGGLEMADAWLGALAVEAQLNGRVCRDRTLGLGVELRIRQGRFEEARVLAVQLVARSRRTRLGAHVMVQAAKPRNVFGGGACGPLWAGGNAMYLLGAIPALLQVMAGATEHDALAGAAEWARRSAAARGVSLVASGTGRLIVSAGVAAAPVDRRAALERSEPVVVCDGPSAVATAPICTGASMMAGVVVSGSADRPDTLREAATILAIVCAPLVKARLDALAALEHGRDRVPEVLGVSPAVQALRDDVVRLAPAPFAVLVEGESGTGKELVARALHRLSARRDRRFVAVNCAALSDDLIEAELFGHSRGAFTGAVAPRAGLFEDAHGGTLFLDEVAELSMRAQAKLLRVLQERELRRVGENHARPVDIRVVAATNRPLIEAVRCGAFREDLLFRLAVVRIRLTPLRDRVEDIAPLSAHFWQKTMAELGKGAVLGPDALARIASHDWPGNVRELQNVLAGLGVAAPQRGRVPARLVEHVLASSGSSGRRPPMSLAHARHLCDRQTVTAALARHAGRRSAAARELGVTRQGLGKLMRRLRLIEGVVEGAA